MNTIEIEDEKINVEEIMSNIRGNIQKRRASGAYDPNIESLINQPLQRPTANAGEGDIKSDLDYLNSHWDVHAEYSIYSHQPIIGQLLISGRQLIHGEVKRYVDLIAGKQTEFNMRIIRSLKNLLDLLESRITSMNNRIDRVDNRITEVKDDIDRKVSSNVNEMLSMVNNDIKNKAWLANLLDERIKENNIKKNRELPNYDILNYFLFEEKYRGSTDDIKKRQTIFLEYFRNCHNILDIGCGRGEFLSLLKENNIGAKGIDLNEDMVLFCQKNGFDVKETDALSYLESLENKSLDGIFSGQVVEHLQPGELIDLVKLCYDKMKYGTYFIAETINPLCLSVFAKSFYMDLSHVKPVHPATIKFLMESAGFREVEFKFFSPHSDDAKLAKFEITDDMDDKNRQHLKLMNQNIDKINELLYGFQDYAVIGKK